MYLPAVLTDRTRIETWEKCPRKRFFQFEYEGRGLEPADERGLKLDARIGSGVHEGIEWAVKNATTGIPYLATAAATYGMKMFDAEVATVDLKNLPEQQQQEVVEARHLVGALVMGWVRLRLPSLLAEGTIVAIEQEMCIDFPTGTHTVRLMTRPDIVWRRATDGALFIRNLKTVRDPKTTWREQWALDMQTLSEPLAAEAKFGEPVSGVIIDGLVTGAVLDYPRGSGNFYHNTPLLYGWMRKGDAPFGEDEWYPKYEWTCIEPHVMGNGRKCDGGGKTHKLSGVTKQPVWERYPGGVGAWMEYLLAHEPAIAAEEIIELPPIIRSPYAIERWKRQVLLREVTIHQHAEVLNKLGVNETILDIHFPMHTASGNCLRPGRCMAYDLCHGSAAAAPLESSYQWRTLHHAEEAEMQKEKTR